MGNIRCSDLYDKFYNLVELLRYRALTQPFQIAYTFNEKGEKETARITYQVLDQASRALVPLLPPETATGERAREACIHQV
ncbi:MAG: fatty acyl-AMP ligase [Moorea sp. SIO4A3]|nr:fatty acyl-AMP ligase [Moorena sp. SIO4A3]